MRLAVRSTATAADIDLADSSLDFADIPNFVAAGIAVSDIHCRLAIQLATGAGFDSTRPCSVAIRATAETTDILSRASYLPSLCGSA